MNLAFALLVFQLLGVSSSQKDVPLVALVQQGRDARLRGDLRGARAAFERVLAEQPNNAEVNLLLGNVFVQEALLPQAMTCFERVLATNLRSEEARRRSWMP